MNISFVLNWYRDHADISTLSCLTQLVVSSDMRAVGKLLCGSLAAFCLPAAIVVMNPTDNFWWFRFLSPSNVCDYLEH